MKESKVESRSRGHGRVGFEHYHKNYCIDCITRQSYRVEKKAENAQTTALVPRAWGTNIA